MAKQDPTESRAAAEQFRRNSHRENATDPQVKAAQSHVLAASIEAKTRFPKKEDQARYIENAKETVRSEEHTSELQSLMRISYAVFCLTNKQKSTTDDPLSRRIHRLAPTRQGNDPPRFRCPIPSTTPKHCIRQ